MFRHSTTRPSHLPKPDHVVHMIANPWKGVATHPRAIRMTPSPYARSRSTLDEALQARGVSPRTTNLRRRGRRMTSWTPHTNVCRRSFTRDQRIGYLQKARWMDEPRPFKLARLSITSMPYPRKVVSYFYHASDLPV